MIKALIFDLGNTIVPFDFDRGYLALRPYCDLTPAQLRARISETQLAERFESGQIDSAAFVGEMEAIIGSQMDYAEFCRIWNSVFFPDTLLDAAFFAALKERYTLVLLSNTNAIHFEMLRECYPELSHFHHFVLSYEVGAMKPAAEIYQEAIRRAGCAPAECFFADDIPVYIDAARSHGIDAVRFESRAQIEAALRERGVTW